MKTVQMTLDEQLLDEVELITRDLGTTRSAFTRLALQHELQRQRLKVMEQRQIDGYRKAPPVEAELTGWEDEQQWVDG